MLGVPRSARAYPCVLAALARVPFRWSERGLLGAHPHPGPLRSRERGFVSVYVMAVKWSECQRFHGVHLPLWFWLMMVYAQLGILGRLR